MPGPSGPVREFAIAERLARHAVAHRPVVVRALELLARDFDKPDDLDPTRAARFTITDPPDRDELDDASADAHGYVADLLAASKDLGLLAGSDNEADAP